MSALNPRLLLFLSGALLASSSRLPAISAPALPVIPNQTYYVTNYGAVGDGVTTNTAAIQNAINAASASALHGGTVEFTAGTFLSGPLTVPNSIDLQLDSGATLRALPYGQYPTPPPNFISASSRHDIAITGTGTIDGQGAPWWPGYKTNSRPYLVNFSSCTRVLVQGITFLNAPAQNLVIKGKGGNVTIQGVTFSAPSSSDPINPSHNTDAIDLAETNCVIQNCYIDVGDDNVALGSSAGVTADVLITNCVCGNGHGISLGSYTSSGVSNLTVIDCTFNGTDNGIRMKSDNTRGGLARNLCYYNLGMTNVRFPIVIYSYYDLTGTPSSITPATAAAQPIAPVTSTTPIWRGITISNLVATAGANGIAGIIWGRTELAVTNVTLAKVNITAPRNFDFYNAQGVRVIDSQINLPAGAQTFSVWNTGLTVSNSAPGGPLVSVDGLPGTNSLGLYNAPAVLGDSTALGANPLSVSGCTLTVTNDLTLSPGTVLSFALGTNASTIAATGNLALNGTVNANPGPGFDGGNYTLFTYGGGLTWGTISLGSAPSGYNFDTNTTGQVRLATGQMPSVTPVPIQWQVTTNQLALSWPTDHQGWSLQVQTNAPGQGLSMTWATLAGSRQTNNFFVPIDPHNASVFMRLVYP